MRREKLEVSGEGLLRCARNDEVSKAFRQAQTTVFLFVIIIVTLSLSKCYGDVPFKFGLCRVFVRLNVTVVHLLIVVHY